MATDPADAGQQPANVAPWVIVLIASADGIKAISRIVSALPNGLPAAVLVLQHRTSRIHDLLPDILQHRAAMPVVSADQGQPVKAGRIYVNRPGRHLTIDDDLCFNYVDGTRVKHLLASADPLLASAAKAFGAHVIAVILTGRGTDAAEGVWYVRDRGGLVIAQDPATTEHPQMVEAAVATGQVNAVLPPEQIAPRLIDVVTCSSGPRTSRRLAM